MTTFSNAMSDPAHNPKSILPRTGTVCNNTLFD
jgi:hypothetical protein